MSALAAFFSRLPTPEQHDDHIKKHGIADHRAVYGASVHPGYVLGEDDDLSTWIKSRQPESLEYAYMFWHSVFHLATTNARLNLDEDTDVAKRIRFYRWIARGRNDAEKDLLHKSTTSATLADRITACLLPPKSNLGCACCGKSPSDSDKFSHCAGCAISSDCGNYKVLCTFYRSKTCQMKHWPDHKTTCAPRRKILRAGSLLQQLMKFIEITGSDVLWKRIYDNEKGITFSGLMSQSYQHHGRPCAVLLAAPEPRRA